MCLFEQRCEHLRVEDIGSHLPNSGLRPCPRIDRTSIRTARLVAYSKEGWRECLTAYHGKILASASSLRIGTEAPLTMDFVLAHCPDIVGMAPSPPRRQTMCSPSHVPSPSHSLFARAGILKHKRFAVKPNRNPNQKQLPRS